METVRINGTLFNIQDSFSINFNNFETLNNAEIKLKINDKVEFAYFDEIIIDKYYFYLVDYELVTIRDGKYLYKMQVVNPSLQLQNIFLPNRAVEKGTNLLDLFFNYILMYKSNLSLSSELVELIRGSTTMQNTWNEPTLFEVFNTLLQPFNAIITMTDFNTLSYIKLDERGKSIDDLFIKDIVYKTDYVNHATEFKSQLKNAISDHKISETVFLTTPNEPILNDNKFQLELAHPIEKILNIHVDFYGKNNVGEIVTEGKGITNMLVERSVYETLKPSNKVDLPNLNDYKRNHIYYETGKNIIGGFDYDDKTWIPIIEVSKPSYEYWGFQNKNVDITRGIRGTVFTVYYVAQLNDVGVSLKKNALNTGDKTMLVNQDEAYLDLDAFATKQTLDLERAGEMSIDIYGEGTPPDLMDYYEDYNIYSLNVVYEKNKTSWFAEAKRGFSYSNLRTAISSEKRFTSIEGPDRAFLSNHVENHSFEFSEIEKPLNEKYKNVAAALMFRDFVFKRLMNVIIDDKYFIFAPLLEKYGNSLISNYRFKDNYSAGLMRLDGGEQVEIPYVDINGEFKNIRSKLIAGSAFNIMWDAFPDEYDKYANEFKKLPLVDNGALINAINNRRYIYDTNRLRNKTNREITAETQQFSLLSNELFTVWNNYLKDVAWGESNRTFKNDNYEILINRSNRLISKVDYNFLTENLDISKWIQRDNYFEFDIEGDITGLLIKNKVDNKPILAYNGSKKKIFIIDSYKRYKISDNNEYNDLFGSISININNNIDGAKSINVKNININISSLLDNEIIESIELFGLVGVGVNNEININESISINNLSVSIKGLIESEELESIELYGLVGVSVSQVNELEQTLNITNNVFVTGLIETEIIEELLLYGGVKVSVNNEIDVDKPLRPNLSVSIKGVMVNEELNRVRLTFISQGVVYTEMNVNVGELLYYPSTPTRPNYTFNGWYSNTSGGTRLNNPFVAPSIDTTYYAQWTHTPQNLTWQYYGKSSSSFCSTAGYNPIGTACTTQGKKMTVGGEDIGRPDGCYELICKI